MSKTRKTTKTAPPSPPSVAHDDAAHVTITGENSAANHKKKVDLQASWAALIAGLRANYAPTDTFVIMDRSLTRDEVLEHLKRFIAAAERTKVSRKAYFEAVQEEHAVFAALRPTRDGVVAIVRARHGKSSQRLLQYGIAPTRSTRRSVAVKSAAVEKAQATRALRGTKGRRQRLAIKADPAAAALAAAPPNGAPASPESPAPAPLPPPAPAPLAAPKSNGAAPGAGHSI